jgi:LemA protein
MLSLPLRRPAAWTPLLFLFLLTLLAGCGINTIPTLEEEVNAGWAQVQNQYQRRADLIPNLVETVKGFAQQERDVLIAVTEARAKVAQTQLPPDILTNEEAFRQFEQNQAELTGALGRLLVVVEQYPELRSNQNFLALQSQLEGTENRIAVARRDYIQAVQRYNTEIRTVPGRFWAVVYGAEPKATFAASEGAEQAPRVTF